MKEFETILNQAKNEIENLNEEDFQTLMGGYDNRGLDCISQRWYGPENNSTPNLKMLGEIILEIEDMFREFYIRYEE